MKVNILVDHLGSCQLSYYLIKCVNQLVGEGYSVIVFYDKMSRHVLRPAFPTMQMVECWAQPGITIATSMNTAINLIDFPGPQHKLYYVYDMEWMRGAQRMWGAFHDLFTHPELKLIARTPEYATIIENAFNKKPEYTMDNFNPSSMKDILTDVTD